jgi:hypothetical protein
MHPLNRAIIQNRDDLSPEEKKQTEAIFDLFQELAESLMVHDKVVVLNALNLLTEFFMGELQDERRL